MGFFVPENKGGIIAILIFINIREYFTSLIFVICANWIYAVMYGEVSVLVLFVYGKG